MIADPRARWAESLRVATDAPADVVESAFLRALARAGFFPAAELVAAANALAGTAAPVGRDDDVKQLLRDEVAAFASRFWTLTLAERLLTWSDLSRRGADPVRLRELEPGLDVAPPALTDPAAEEIASLVRELFTLRPRARALRRNAWLLERAAEIEKWRAAHAVVQREAPTLAALEPRLSAMDSGFHTAFVEGASAAPLRHTRMSSHVELAGFSGRVRHRAAGDTGGGSAPGYAGNEYEPDYPDGSRSGNIPRGLLVGFLLICFGCCALNPFRNRSSNESAVYKPAANAPHPVTPREPSRLQNETFTAAQVAVFELYEKEFSAGTTRQPPPGYDAWLRAARPRGVWPALREHYVAFTEAQIRACQAHDVLKNGPAPSYYDDWVQARRPTAPRALSRARVPLIAR